MNVLVFSPHPDDDVLGCGGSIIKHAQMNHQVTVVYLTSGEAGNIRYSKAELAGIREDEARQASLLLGTSDVIFLRYEDGYLTYNKDTLIPVVNLIRLKQPDIVYVPHKNDGHKDHIATNEIVLEAIERAKSAFLQDITGKPWLVRDVLCYEVWTPLQNITYVEDISQQMQKKLQAVAVHQSQIENRDYHEAIAGLNRYRGVMTRKGKYCECFKIIKKGR
jgi:LmbE family N-acetylglucosaminyl deacetylase